ncbi:HesA/MoeB/ThiF family protein [Streptomyces sp. NPDC015661]|uniref:HesA/MoeB/ThiF family protein n=1 Tax=Streptomyces sp. NPDC015661 TaxID=3364961 RepID=UPI0036F4F7B9
MASPTDEYPATPGRRLRLVESVVAVPASDGLRFVQGARALHVRGPAARLGKLAERLRAGLDERDLHGARLAGLAGELKSLGWLTEHPPHRTEEPSATERQQGYLTVFGPDAPLMQSRIEAARVAVLGVGGVGTVVAQHLVGAGVRRLWLVDFDTVALHNLNRQFLFGLGDVGTPKVEAAAAALRRLNPRIDVTGLHRRVEEAADLTVLPADLDLLVVAADTPRTIVGIAWLWAREYGVPVHMAAVGLESGYWGPLLIPDRGHCWSCFERGRRARLPAGQAALEDADLAPTPYSFGPSNTVISALLAHDALEYLATGRCPSENRRGRLALDGTPVGFLEGLPCECADGTVGGRTGR